MNLNKKENNRVLLGAAISMGLTALAVDASALQALPDEEMSSVVAKAGITLKMNEPAAGITASSAALLTNNPTPWTPNEANELGVRLSTINIKRATGVTSPFFTATLDFGVPTASSDEFVALSAGLARSQIDIGAVNLAGTTSGVGSGSLGHYLIETPIDLSLVGRNLFDSNTASYGSSLSLNFGKVNKAGWAPGYQGATDPGKIFWRRADDVAGTSPEMVMNDFSFLFELADGRFGFKNNSFVIQSKTGSKVGFSLSLDMLYDGSGSSAFAIGATDKPMLFWGWRGHWTDLNLEFLKNGGRVDGSGRGINSSIKFNYDPDFVWAVGEGGDKPGYLEFGNWTKLPNNTYAFDIPFFSIEALAGGATAQGKGGLCWGNAAITATANNACSGAGVGPVASLDAVQPIKVRRDTDPSVLAITFRDMALSAYASTVKVVDRTLTGKAGVPVVTTYNWALIYTLADLDAELFVSPYADGQSARLDLAVMSQTHAADANSTDRTRWNTGTNFMIGDSDTDFGIGLMGADVLIALRNGRMGMTSTGIKTDAPLFRYQLRGMLGGGAIPDMTIPQQMAYVDVNVEADRYVFTIGPGQGVTDSYLAYSGFINLANLSEADFASPSGTGNHAHDDGSYLSFAEPSFSKRGIDVRFADVRGSVGVGQGRIEMQGEGDLGAGKIQLLVSNNLYVGLSSSVPCAWGVSCTEAAGNPLVVNTLEFGGKSLGSLAMPSGIVRSQVTIFPKIP
ncbi:MAG TPA: hypothetical protein VFX11_03775 [Candidatus Kapabacteria bacterium]|nr:hypothetical protein [Candidatus Kapabacteria bacterium]